MTHDTCRYEECDGSKCQLLYIDILIIFITGIVTRIVSTILPAKRRQKVIVVNRRSDGVVGISIREYAATYRTVPYSTVQTTKYIYVAADGTVTTHDAPIRQTRYLNDETDSRSTNIALNKSR